MEKLLLALSFFTLPLVAMEGSRQQPYYPSGTRKIDPQFSLAMKIRFMAEQRDVRFSEMDEVVARLIAKNMSAFQQATEGNSLEDFEQLLKKMAPDSKLFTTNMVQEMVESYLSCSEAEKGVMMKGLLMEDGNGLQAAVKRQLERVANILSMAHKMHIAERVSSPSEK